MIFEIIQTVSTLPGYTKFEYQRHTSVMVHLLDLYTRSMGVIHGGTYTYVCVEYTNSTKYHYLYYVWVLTCKVPSIV